MKFRKFEYIFFIVTFSTVTGIVVTNFGSIVIGENT